MDQLSECNILYNLNKCLLSRYSGMIPKFENIKTQLSNLFAIPSSPALMIITCYYLSEIKNYENTKFIYDPLGQMKWCCENLIYFKDIAFTIRMMRNKLIHSNCITMDNFDDCVKNMLRLANMQNQIAKCLVDIIIDGLINICYCIKDGKESNCCPLCKSSVTNGIRYDFDVKIIKQEYDDSYFSEKAYTSEEIKQTKLKDILKGKEVKIMSGKYEGSQATLKSWVGTTTLLILRDKDSIDKNITIHKLIPLLIPKELSWYL